MAKINEDKIEEFTKCVKPTDEEMNLDWPTPKKPPKITTHYLKTWPEYYKAILTGAKTFEVRKNDRDFKVGDILVLQEWDPTEPKDHVQPTGPIGYTGRSYRAYVSYVLHATGPAYKAIEEGYVVLGIIEALHQSEIIDP